MDEASSEWLTALRASAPIRDQAIERLHAMLLGVARGEAFRRRGSLGAEVVGELDDICMQAANDALGALLRKLDEFRGASRFTTWAYKFAVLEVSVRLRRRAWTQRRVALDQTAWEQMADSSPGGLHDLEEDELLRAVRNAVDATLTDHQRRVFLAATIEEVPIDVLAERLGSTRGAVYKALHDARRRLRETLTASGHLEVEM